MLSFSSDELAKLPAVNAGDVFLHRQCGQMHELQPARNANGSYDYTLLWFQCGESSYIAAINNRFTYDNGGRQ